MTRLILAVIAVQVADLWLSLLAVSAYGPQVEQNPLTAGALALGPVGLIAWKAALTALVFAAAALNGRWRRLLLGGLIVSGAVGAASGIGVLA